MATSQAVPSNTVILNPCPTTYAFPDTPVVDKEINRSANGKDYTKPFSRSNAKTLEDASKIAQGVRDIRGHSDETAESVLVDFFNSAFDLYVRARFNPLVESDVSGPDKLIDKAAKAISDALGIPLEDARAQVVAQRKERGMDV